MKTANLWRLTAVLALVGSAWTLGIAGCSSESSGHSSLPDTVSNRPVVEQTSVETALKQDTTPLTFFDDLESRPLASQDDAINACLLLGTGSSAPSYEERLAMAAKLGYVPKTYARPARQAVTMGEVSTMAVKLLEGRNLDQSAALDKLVQRGIAPASAKTNQGLTGAQLVSIAGGVRDAMSIEGVKRVAAPHIEISRPAMQHNTAVADSTTGAPVPPEAMGSVDGVSLGAAAKGTNPSAHAASAESQSVASGEPVTALPPSKGRAESLPNIPYGSVPPAIDLSDPKGKPVVIGPDDQVITPGQPRTTTKTAAKPSEVAPDSATATKPPEAQPTTQDPAAAAATATTPAPVSRKQPKWTLGKPLHPPKTADAEQTKPDPNQTK
jgi:hypothetical protein